MSALFSVLFYLTAIAADLSPHIDITALKQALFIYFLDTPFILINCIGMILFCFTSKRLRIVRKQEE